MYNGVREMERKKCFLFLLSYKTNNSYNNISENLFLNTEGYKLFVWGIW